MIAPVTIELVRPREVDQLLLLSRKTFFDAFEHVNNPEDFKAYTAKAFTRKQLLSEIKNPGSAFYFATINREEVGYMKLNYGVAQAEFQDQNSVEISRIYVLAGQQRKQVGKQMIDYAINKAIEDKLHFIWLGVWEHNHSATRFYEREGFVKFGSHEFWVGKDRQTDYLMKRGLNSK